MTPTTALTLAPVAMGFLIIAVGIRMFIERTREMRERRIHLHAVENS